MADEIKTFKITGEAVQHYTGLTKKKRATRKKMDIPPSNEPEPNEMNIKRIEEPKETVISAGPVSVKRENAPPEPVRPPIKEKEDDKKIKVELKRKHAAKTVQLHPKSGESHKSLSKKNETKKKNRKVMLGISALHKRMTRAKKMQKTVKEMPLDKLKEELVKKKLIKPTSKAPESVLRQIAADAQIVEGKAL